MSDVNRSGATSTHRGMIVSPSRVTPWLIAATTGPGTRMRSPRVDLAGGGDGGLGSSTNTAHRRTRSASTVPTAIVRRSRVSLLSSGRRLVVSRCAREFGAGRATQRRLSVQIELGPQALHRCASPLSGK